MSVATGNTASSLVNVQADEVRPSDLASLGARYGSDPGTGLKTTDSLFVTGIAYKLD